MKKQMAHGVELGGSLFHVVLTSVFLFCFVFVFKIDQLKTYLNLAFVLTSVL